MCKHGGGSDVLGAHQARGMVPSRCPPVIRRASPTADDPKIPLSDPKIPLYYPKILPGDRLCRAVGIPGGAGRARRCGDVRSPCSWPAIKCWLPPRLTRCGLGAKRAEGACPPPLVHPGKPCRALACWWEGWGRAQGHQRAWQSGDRQQAAAVGQCWHLRAVAFVVQPFVFSFPIFLSSTSHL